MRPEKCNTPSITSRLQCCTLWWGWWIQLLRADSGGQLQQKHVGPLRSCCRNVRTLLSAGVYIFLKKAREASRLLQIQTVSCMSSQGSNVPTVFISFLILIVIPTDEALLVMDIGRVWRATLKMYSDTVTYNLVKNVASNIIQVSQY